MKFTKLFDGVSDHETTFKLLNRGYTSDILFSGQWFEIKEEEYDYFLGILPPLDFDGTSFCMREFARGNLTNAFTVINDRFFCLTVSRKSAGDFRTQLKAFLKHIKFGG